MSLKVKKNNLYVVIWRSRRLKEMDVVVEAKILKKKYSQKYSRVQVKKGGSCRKFGSKVTASPENNIQWLE